MALSPLKPKPFRHGRSLSLPSKLHPAISRFNENLAKISTSSPLNALNNLYTNIDDLLASPHVQRVISQECHEKWVVDQVLDGYIRHLDACNTAKDLVSHAKHDVQHLLSALRRNDVHGVYTYQTSRKCSKKTIQKALKNLRSFRNAKHKDLSIEKDQETVAVVCMLEEAESVTIAMFENLLFHVIGSDAQAKQSGWSLVSKLLPSKKASHQGEEIDLKHVKEMESSIRIIEEELESLFRQLIKTRVLLLNILNH